MNGLRYPHLFHVLTSQPWAIQPGALEGLAKALYGAEIGKVAISANTEDTDIVASKNTKTQTVGSATMHQQSPIGLVNVRGVIARYISGMEAMCGGFSLSQAEKEIEALVAEGVETIILHIDSPGGYMMGLPAFTEFIKEMQVEGVKFYAWCDTLMASAAYWIAASCDGVFAAPGAQIGSIGVYLMRVDLTKWSEKQGIETHIIKAGERKAEGHPHLAMTDAEREHLQSDIDEAYQQFKSHVLENRPGIDDSVMQGQCFETRKALEAELIDGIYPTFRAFVAGLQE